MSLKSSVEAVVDIKSSPEKFFHAVSNQHHTWPTASPDNLQAVELHEGDWETSGSIKYWNYTIDGKTEVFKEKIVVDEANKKITVIGLEGHVFDIYKTYQFSFEVIGRSVKIVVDVEKLNADSPDPNNYLQFAIDVVKDIDAHLLNQ